VAVGSNSQLKKTGDTIDNGIIRNKVGNSSGCYKQFIYQTKQVFSCSGAIDRRMIIIIPVFYQYKYERYL
jgi:hypothetical protein